MKIEQIRLCVKAFFCLFWLWCAYLYKTGCTDNIGNGIPIMFVLAAIGIWFFKARKCDEN